MLATQAFGWVKGDVDPRDVAQAFLDACSSISIPAMTSELLSRPPPPKIVKLVLHLANSSTSDEDLLCATGRAAWYQPEYPAIPAEAAGRQFHGLRYDLRRYTLSVTPRSQRGVGLAPWSIGLAAVPVNATYDPPAVNTHPGYVVTIVDEYASRHDREGVGRDPCHVKTRELEQQLLDSYAARALIHSLLTHVNDGGAARSMMRSNSFDCAIPTIQPWRTTDRTYGCYPLGVNDAGSAYNSISSYDITEARDWARQLEEVIEEVQETRDRNQLRASPGRRKVADKWISRILHRDSEDAAQALHTRRQELQSIREGSSGKC